MNSVYGLLLLLVTICGILLFPSGRSEVHLLPFDKARTLPLRGLLALFVVIGHCDTRMPGCALLRMLHFATPAVSVFFFLSGYGLVRSVLGNREGYLRGFLARSFIRLGIPLLTATVVACLFLMIRGQAVNLAHRGYELLTRGRNFPYHSWYVYALLIHYVAFALSLARGSISRGIVRFAVFSLAYYLLFRFGLKWPGVWYKTSLAMTFGAVWAYREDVIQGVILRLRWRVYAFVAVVLAVCVLFQTIPKAVFPWVREARDLSLLVIGPATVLVMYILRGISHRLTAVFAFLGGISYEIYLLHFIGERGFVGPFPGPVSYCLATILAAAGSAFLMHYFNAFLIRYAAGKSCRDDGRNGCGGGQHH